MIFGGGADEGFLEGEGRIGLDDGVEAPTGQADTDGECEDIDQAEGIFSTEGVGEEGGSDGNGFIGMDTAMGRFAKESGEAFVDVGHTRHSADEEDLVDIFSFEVTRFHDGFAYTERFIDETFDQAVERVACHLYVEVDGLSLVLEEVGDLDLNAFFGGKIALGFFAGIANALHLDGITAQIDFCFAVKIADYVIDQDIIEVHAAEEGIAACGDDFEDIVIDFEDGRIEGTPAEIVDEEALFETPPKAVGEGGCGGFIDDTLDTQARHESSLSYGLSLVVVVVGRDADDSAVNRLSEVILCDLANLREDKRGDLLEGEDLIIDVDGGFSVRIFDDIVEEAVFDDLNDPRAVLATDQAFAAVDGVSWVEHHLRLCGMSDHDLVIRREGDHGRDGIVAKARGDDAGALIFNDGAAAIGGAEVDANNRPCCGDIF